MSKRFVLSTLSAFGSGIVFAAGLALSGMTTPKKVIGFLDVTGKWDPSLMFVMIGAIAAFAPLYRWIARRSRPVLADTLNLPVKTEIDRALMIGAAIFGVGWGLVGLCPGPAVTAIATGSPKALVFFLAVVTGMALVRACGGVNRSRRKG